MTEATVTKVEFTNLRAEAKKLYDGLHIGLPSRLLRTVPASLNFRAEFLDLRSHVWGIREYCLSPHESSADTSVPPRTRSTDALKERAKLRSTSLIEIRPGVLFRTPLRSRGSDPCVYFDGPRWWGVPVQNASSGCPLPHLGKTATRRVLRRPLLSPSHPFTPRLVLGVPGLNASVFSPLRSSPCTLYSLLTCGPDPFFLCHTRSSKYSPPQGTQQ